MVWNFAFVYGTAAPGDPRGWGAGFGLVHLGVPLLWSRGRAERWLQGRVFALCLAFVFVPTGRPPIETPHWYDITVAATLGAVALVLALAAVAQRLYLRSSQS